MKSTTIDLNSLIKPDINPPELKENSKRFFKAIGENRQGRVIFHYKRLNTKPVLEVIAYTILYYKMEPIKDLDDHIFVYGYSNFFEPIVYNSIIPVYYLQIDGDVFRFLKS